VNRLLFTSTRLLFRHAGNCYPALFARWGLHLWGKTNRPPWRSWELRILKSGRREFISIENEKVALYHWGHGGQKILLLPGWNSRASHFRNYIERLTARGYEVIGLDPVGHGHSSGSWTNIRQYLAVIQVVGDKYGPFHAIIGHSFGGFCTPYALNRFNLSSKAVLLATPNNLMWLFERFTGILQAPASVREQMQHQVEQLLGDDCWQEYSVTEQAKHLAHRPAMIVHDIEDIGVPVSHARKNQAAWPQSRLLVTRKLGHHRVLRHPSAVKPVIQFITE